MKYTIYITTDSNNKFIYKLGTRPETSDFSVGQVSNYFQTRELAEDDARRQLKKLGVKDEDIVLSDN